MTTETRAGGPSGSPEARDCAEEGPTRVAVQRLAHGEGLALPAVGSAGSAGFDIRAAIDQSMTLAAGEFCAIPTGLAFEIPVGWEAQVRPRSGLARRHGVTVLNSPGTIDSDYRGEVQVLLINHGKKPFVIERGERIAQIVIGRVAQVEWVEVKRLGESERGQGGFGSTGRG